MLLIASLLLSGLAFIKAAAPVDWIERSPNGAYELAYATGDEGAHYKTEAATAGNQRTGKFGHRDPATGGLLETTYTAGRRGYRPRGPHIARRISLSQAGPVRPIDDGQYHPEFDKFDPSESQAYDFSFSTRDVVKEEHADEVGDVRGRYSYLDDRGVRRNVEYTAGRNKGFNVLNAVPDSLVQAQNTPLVFQGKRPVDKIRGLTAIQKSPDGSYRFAAAGPDHKRAEIKDAFGNTRGSYSYIDDRGQQRTVEYIAGPNIGFQIINGRRPLLPALFPNIPEVSSTPASLSPFFPEVTSTLSPFFSDVSSTTSSFFSDLFPDNASKPVSPSRPSTTQVSGRPTPPTNFQGGSLTSSGSYPGRPSSESFPMQAFNNFAGSSQQVFPGQQSPDKFQSVTSTPPTSTTPVTWIEDFGSLHQQLFTGDSGLSVTDVGSGSISQSGGSIGQSGGSISQSGGSISQSGGSISQSGGSIETSGGSAHTKSCCKGPWHTGGLRGRAVRAHVQSIDISQSRHMSPGDALEQHS